MEELDLLRLTGHEKRVRTPLGRLETTELAETPVHVEHSDVMLFISSGGILQAPRYKAEACNRSSSRNSATNNIPSARCSAKCPNRKFLGSAALRRMGLIFSGNGTFRLRTHELRYKLCGRSDSEFLEVDRNSLNSTFLCVRGNLITRWRI